MKKYIVFLPNEMASAFFGAALAITCQRTCVIYLCGDLGVGKTTFCRGFLRALGHTGNVKSPTYLLVESYVLPSWTVYHFDLYRLANAEELDCMGIRDYFNDTALYLVEWPQRGKGILPTADIELTLHYQGDGRQAEVQAFSATGECVLDQLLLWDWDAEVKNGTSVSFKRDPRGQSMVKTLGDIKRFQRLFRRYGDGQTESASWLFKLIHKSVKPSLIPCDNSGKS
ncbi:MAG: hypothetical protein HNEKOMLI_00777 [Sodalis sp. Psp]|nr:hypothetical protein [Sodalis sp. Psp]MCR3757246.1 hypothetical protein [Sodalis sp. Ppy]